MRTLRALLFTAAALLLCAMALLAGLWWWSGSDSSLHTALQQAQRYLPAGQTLQAEGVQGSLRSGGRIALLRWQDGALQVQAHDVQLGWSLGGLLEGDLQLGQVQVALLRIDDQRPSTAPQAPTSFMLPLRVKASFGIDQLEWAGPPALSASGIRGDYRFDGAQHTLNLQQAQIASGQYQLQARLQAVAPMQVTLQAGGLLQTPLPASQRPLQVKAHATLDGTLAGAQATLQLQASLTPDGAAGAAQAARAQVQARIAPWQPQPVQQAQAQWQALDLAALWPQAPQTQLSGNARVEPAADSWRGELQMRNTRSGAWDLQRLPLESLQGRFVYRHGSWDIEQLQATGAGGKLSAQGQYNADPKRPWEGRATLQGVNPAALHTQLASGALDGTLSARQSGAGIAFEARLQGGTAPNTSASSNSLPPLKLLQTRGLWQSPQLQLDALRVETNDAVLQGQLRWNMRSLATSGQLDLSLPGASATVGGALAATQGQGQARLQVTDAALAGRWLARWPFAPALVRETPVRGRADATLQWSGGWQARGQELQLQAQLKVPQLDSGASTVATGATDTNWRLRDAQATLRGSLSNLQLQSGGQLERGTQRYVWQTSAQGGYGAGDRIQAQLLDLKLTLQNSLRPGNWTVQLADRVALQWADRTLDVAPGAALLSGPAPGTARLQWQAGRWAQKKAGAQWHSQGQLQNLPLAWLEVLGQQQIGNLGLRGDLLFDGQWDATLADTLQLRASLQRKSGDLALLGDDGTRNAVAAGLREASLVLEACNDRASARLRWDSESAGQATADFSTQLQHGSEGWSWRADAPVAGMLSAQLPRVGVWSLLAPPGWRLRGTLDARATLTGTRAQPAWHGTLQADDLAVRSVVDGIDFSQGSLRVRLDGQQLAIDAFTLRGVGGASGGLLSLSGRAEWLSAPAGGASATLASRLNMDLTGVAEALRVSTRADQRLVVSGRVTAALRQAKLQLRGSLRADQALFILPEDSAPTLGQDVVVRSTQAAAKATTPAPRAAQRIVPDIQLALDLGPSFYLQGHGLSTRLEGTLELRSTPGQPLLPRLSGVLHTALGTYKAYGQQLDIEEGTLRFTGAYDNPSLDILAIRPNTQQRVGVQVNGTAQLPQVRLYSEPDLPDAEKLSWLILGRPSAEGGADTALLQQAALGLLANKGGNSGGLAGALGLDELSVRGAASGDSATSTANSGASVTLGKRLTRNFYVAYERSLAGTLGTFYIFYDLSRRFTLRAQSGEESAVDLIFTVRYD